MKIVGAGCLRYRGILSIVVLVLFCYGCIHRPVTTSWTRLEPGFYRYDDRDLAIECRIGERHISWHFKNTAFVPLTIDAGEIGLRIEGDPVLYTLWGSRRDQQTSAPPIVIKSQGFVRFDYPVRFDSPLFPFRISEETLVYLELSARWGKALVPYQIRFLVEGEKAAETVTR